MAHDYRAVGWNRQKRIYDLTLVGGMALYLAVFAVTSLLVRPGITIETLLIRGFGTLAFLLLNVTLSIGPLARLDTRLLPLLYNRRHLGVATFLTALAHAIVSLVQFHSLGDLSPLVSLLVSNGSYADLAFFPFQILGLLALLILFLMAATSHDFWLNLLTPTVWKSLHMSVYVAWLLLIGHVALGVLQAETHPALVMVLAASVIWIGGLHIAAGWRGRHGDSEPVATGDVGRREWVDAGPASGIADGSARVVRAGDERVAVFRDGDRYFALGNVCAHQGGPLGEGRVRDGCAVCPWHGYEYRLESGQSPPPFEESVPLYEVRVRDQRLQVQRQPAEQEAEPALWSTPANSAEHRTDETPFYVGYQSTAPAELAATVRRVVALLLTCVALLAAGLAAWQDPFSNATFEYGVESTLTGTLVAEPLPHLVVHRGAADAPEIDLLVRPGKHGFDSLMLAGRQVTVNGSRIYNQFGRMVEVHSIDATDDSPTPVPPLVDLGPVVLEGEIVDAKCWLGVMKPGRKKTHRACASLCIRGGIPPILITEIDGQPVAPALVSDEAPSVGSHLLDRLAEPVRVEGRLARRGDLLFLHLDGDAIQRLHPPTR